MQVRCSHRKHAVSLAASLCTLLVCAGTSVAAEDNVTRLTNSAAKYTEILTSWEALLEARESRLSTGLRLTDVERYEDYGTVEYLARWSEGDDKDLVWRTTGWAGFEAKTRELAEHDMRLVDVEVYLEQGETHYLGVWRTGRGNFALWTCPTWDAFTERWQQMAMNGLQLADIEVYSDAAGPHYFGLFRSDVSEAALWQDEDWDEISQ